MLRNALLAIPVAAVLGYVAYSQFNNSRVEPKEIPPPEPAAVPAELPPAGLQLATFGSGCFWCTEAVFQQLKGVKKVESGYSGGHVLNPTYEQVCTGTTGHAEVVQVTFDPAVVSFSQLLEVFWASHDPTTPDQQGADVGPQYRSVVFTHTDAQLAEAESYKQKIDAAKVYAAPLVTEIVPFDAFFPAEANHQDFYDRNKGNGYCRAVITPKLNKLKAVFKEKLKGE